MKSSLKILSLVCFLIAVAALLSLSVFAAGSAVKFDRTDVTVSIGGTEYAKSDVTVDADGNGKFDAGDARFMLRLTAQLEKADDPAVFDMSGDGKLDASDARIALRISAKLDNIFTDEDGNHPEGVVKGDDGKTYGFSKYGAAITGKYEEGSSRWFFDKASFAAVDQFVKEGSDIYNIKADGKKPDGSAEYNGRSYEFKKGVCHLRNGLKKEGDVYHFYEDDALVTSAWRTTDDRTVYLTEDGTAAIGLVTIDGSKYYFKSNADLVKEAWKDIDGQRYYFTSDGSAAIGLLTINGKLYGFDADCYAIKGKFARTGGNTYYFGSNYAAASGFTKVNDKTYYFDPQTNIMATDTEIDGYTIGSDGVAEKLTEIFKYARQIAQQNNLRNPTDIYNYLRRNHSFAYNDISDSYKWAQGWTWAAEFGFRNYTIECFNFAAMYAIILDTLGYENRIIHGTGHYDTEHFWNQVRENGQWVNYDACNGYCGVSTSYLQGRNYTFDEVIYPEFD